MRFVLVYQGPLHSTGNRKKGAQPQILAIRQKISQQLRELWRTSAALNELGKVGWIPARGGVQGGMVSIGGKTLSLAERNRVFPGSAIPLFGALEIGDISYRPLVRKSLHLTCELDVTFLRPEDPGQLVSQAGDLDGRIKTLLDALKMPTKDEQDLAPPSEAEIYCLMESDFLVSRLNVETERLLFPSTQNANEVYLIIQVSLKILRVTPYNLCLL